MSATETLTAEQTMDNELAALVESNRLKTETPAETPATPAAETPAAVAVGPPAAAPAAPTEDPITARLAAIEEPKPAEEPKPMLTSDQQQVLSIVPNLHALTDLNQKARSYEQLDNVLASRDFDALETMIAPDVMAEFKEHLYRKHVASGEWVDRWVKDKEGNPATNSAIEAQNRKIQALEAQLAGRSQQEQTAQQQAERKRIEGQYRGHVTSLFDKIEFSANDRKWVQADIDQRVGRDPQLLRAINSGNMPAINGIFKAAVTEYLERDKAAATAAAQTEAAQGKHKPLIQGQAIAETGLLPNDIRQVPAGKEDEWLDQQLGSLKAKHKR